MVIAQVPILVPQGVAAFHFQRGFQLLLCPAPGALQQLGEYGVYGVGGSHEVGVGVRLPEPCSSWENTECMEWGEVTKLVLVSDSRSPAAVGRIRSVWSGGKSRSWCWCPTP